MNSRSVKEWIGASADTPLPTSVYLRLYRQQEGRCAVCTRKLRAGHITIEHIKPLSMGGENRETNIDLRCTVPCASEKTAAEAAPRAKADRVSKKQLGVKTKTQLRRRPLPGTKRSGWKHRADGTWERR